MLVEMFVSGLAMDPNSKMPFVILQDKEKTRSIPIWIGVFEATAIATQLENIALARPMTHDLLKELIVKMGGELKQVEIIDLRNNTYFAFLVTRTPQGGEIKIDARPSDAIALALRTQSPIFVENDVIEKSQAGKGMKAEALSVKDKEQWDEILKNLSPEAFGKYKM